MADWFVSTLHSMLVTCLIGSAETASSPCPRNPLDNREHRGSRRFHVYRFSNPGLSMEDVIVVLGGTAEAAAETAVTRKSCTKCNTEQNIDQFLHARGNGRIVVNCLSCRHKKKLHVISLVKRDYSAQEICHILLGLPLQEDSRVVQSVDCRPHERHARPIDITADGDIQESQTAYERYLRRPASMDDVSYFEFLQDWNFKARNPARWAIWQPPAMPRVLYYYPRYKPVRSHQQYSDFCRVKLLLNHPHRQSEQLLEVDDLQFDNYTSVYHYCLEHHDHQDDHYGTVDEPDPLPEEDEFERGEDAGDITLEDWQEVARLVPALQLPEEPADLLGRRDIDVNCDWTRHIGRYSHDQFGTGGYWVQLRGDAPGNYDVEEMPLAARDTLNTQQQQVYDTVMRHYRAKNENRQPPPLRLQIDGGRACSRLKTLAWIDQRLREVFPENRDEFFGGLSVILIGDFFQLPPVLNKPLYSTRDDLKGIEIVGRNAYLSFDKSVFLTTIQRQQGEDQAPFRRALEELRKADVSVPSWELLASRCSVKLSPEEVDSFADVLRIYPTKAQVVEQSDEGVGAEKVESSDAGNLAKRLPLCVGCRVMLTRNLWADVGLVHGAQGTVYDISWKEGTDVLRDPPEVIMVAFDDYDGPGFTMPNGEPLRSGEKLAVPILRGITLDKVVCDISAPEFASGLSYVAVSRVKTLGGLMFERPFDRSRIYRETPSPAMGLKLSDHATRQLQALDAVAGEVPLRV
ncbi:hypothetical protein CHGG_00999 [Chaetomium globosum CBS 148.51]|uniref:ATP-dependent DNA helicase n=1 Tax=Chaetomium globosum (strain ATCC 6205 / CBS 148.51 / DSM 1962 / NBRC 6347 / NRRL 1970) TaxID=306901 RepID=Q2HFK5_CHAGB|nr:uncharacterized protein CHGG_00999 [Chaetomium globosum CBS 148.51]EAQ92764.1 hypothetical protein CHGG_00999 [Chaetomium globosum CBS 148.51]